MTEPAITALHFTDPGCPWAYSVRPAHARLMWRFGDQIQWRLVMIGLSERSEDYVARGYDPVKQATGLRSFPRRFGMPFTLTVKERIAGTSRACRAIVAARAIDPALGESAFRALQLLQFTTARLLDDDEALRAALADVAGLDAGAIVASIDDPDVIAAYEADKALARTAEGSPTHVQNRHSTSDGPVRYTAPSVIFEHRDGGRIEVGGFQTFDSYDNALAHLDTGLKRWPAPADAAAALGAFPDGLATVEVASLLRGSDLAELDIAGAEAQLIALTGAGTVSCRAAGSSALWRLTA